MTAFTLIIGLSSYVGVSGNSVPLNPMVLLIIIPIKWLFHWEISGIYPIFRQTHVIFTGKKTRPQPFTMAAPDGPLVPLDLDEAADGARDSAGDKPPKTRGT
jgi:hypothetical protein